MLVLQSSVVSLFLSGKIFGCVCCLISIGIRRFHQEIHDAALIDGASSVKILNFITLPMSKRVDVVTALITVIGSYKIFTEIQILTGGGPGRATEVLATTMYETTF